MINDEDRKLLEMAMSEPAAPVPARSMSDDLNQIISSMSLQLGMPLQDVELIEPQTADSPTQVLIWRGWYVINPEKEERVQVGGKVTYRPDEPMDSICLGMSRSVALSILLFQMPYGRAVQEAIQLSEQYQTNDLLTIGVKQVASRYIVSYLDQNDGLPPRGTNILRKVAGIVNEIGMEFTPLINGLKLIYDMKRRENGAAKK